MSAPQAERRHSASSLFIQALSGLVLVLSVTALVGWHTGSARLIWPFPAYVTAFSFVLLGGALFALTVGHRKIARLAGALTAVLMLLNIPAGFLMRWPAVGGMRIHAAPNTAAAVICLATAMVLASFTQRSRWRSPAIALLGSAALALGVNVFAGYLTGYDFGRGRTAPMAIHTSVGIILLSAGVMASSWRLTTLENRRTWVVSAIAAAALVTSVSLWQAMRSLEHSYIQVPLHRPSDMPGIILGFALLVLALLSLVAFLAERAINRAKAAEQAESERKKSDEMRVWLASIVDSAQDAVIGKGLDGTIMTWNGGAERLYGYGAGEIVGKPVSLVCPPERRSEPLEILKQIANGKRVEHYETERVRKDGRRIWLSLTVSPVFESDGSLKGASTIARDITDRKKAEAALKTSEALLRSVIDASTDLIFVKDRELKLVLCNEAYRQSLQKEFDEILGKSDIELGWSPEFVRGNRSRGVGGWEFDDHAALGGETVRVSAEPCNIGPAVRFFDTVKAPIRNETGQVVSLVGISRDITERKQAEEALRQSEAAFRTLADAVPGIVWMCTPDGLHIYFNKRWTDYTGLTLEQSYGRNWNTPFHPDDKQTASQAWNQAMSTGEPYLVESRLRASDGGYRWFLMRGLPLRDAAGDIVKWVGTCTDINDIKQAEDLLRQLNEDLRRANNYNRSLVEANLDPLAIISPDGKILDVNEAAEKATGFGRNALLGTDFSNYFTDPEKARTAYERVLSRASWTEDYELEIRNGEGSIPVLYKLSPFYSEAGGLAGVFADARDITQRKRAENELKELNATLERRVAGRTADLLALNRELESFNYSVSHDLRAPLRHIDGFARILAEDHANGLSVDARRCVDRICEGARRMGRMVDELLELSRMSRKELSRTPTDLSQLVADALAELKPSTEGRDIAWKIGRLPTLNCDATLVYQVFANLLANAVKFSRSRAPAVIEVGACTTAGHQQCLFVRDNGVGFNMKYADKLFGAFQRLHRRDEFEGTGIGLATVQRIVQKHGGSVWAEAAEDRGATFYFTLGPGGEYKPDLQSEDSLVAVGV